MNIVGLPTDAIAKNIATLIEEKLDYTGIYYRIFSRCKSSVSIKEKIERKKYTQDGKKLQDIIGIRIALYFYDDIPLCKYIIKNLFNIVNISASQESETHFAPERLNFVCTIPQEQLELIDGHLWENYPIDKTFEIQLRTVFSEGWHEIEHDVRYKSKTDWKQYTPLSRKLNGLLATLETCDWSILTILNELAYKLYKDKQWAEMLKNKMRIHLINDSINPSLKQILDTEEEVSKAIYRADRNDVLHFLSETKGGAIPLTADNLIYIINEQGIQNPKVAALAPNSIKKFFRQIKDVAK